MNYSLFLVGILQSVLNLAMFLAEVPSGVISDRIGRKKSLLLGHFMVIVYLAMFLSFHNFIALFIAPYYIRRRADVYIRNGSRLFV